MNKTRWMFEFHAIRKMENSIFEAYFKILQKLLVNTMGLGILLPQDENGHPKNVEDMTEAEKDQYIPLTAWVGNTELLKKVKEQQDFINKELGAFADKQYEEMVAAIDAAGGDMEPIIGLETNIDYEALNREAEEKKLGNIKINKIDTSVSKI